MLAPTNPKTLKTIEEIQRLEVLLNEIIPEAKADPTTNLDRAYHKCGTPSCLMGRAIHRGIVEPYHAHNDLGLTQLELNLIFGYRCEGTLDDRAQAITRIIERKRLEIGL